MSLFFAIFFLTHCLSSRHVGDRPFPGSTCSVRPCLVITSLLPSNDASLSFFFRLLCLSLSLDALVCRWGARVANSSHERDRLRQYRAAIVYRFRDPMLRNDVSKFRVLMCIILGLVSNEDNRLVYQWGEIRRIRISCYLKVWSILKIFFNCIYLSKIYFFKMELLFCQFTLLHNIASI